MASFTSEDSRHANRSVNGRYLLHRLNVAAAITPQIVSHIVVEIYPANPLVDFRFNEKFADQAIILKIDWHSSGKGCVNSTCYSTYPKGKMCDVLTPSTIFMTGKRQRVEACQPACFVRQRQNALLKRASAAFAEKSLFTDSEDPRKCVECDHLNELITDHVLRHRVDGTYDLWDARTRQKVTKFPPGFHTRDALEDEDHQPKVQSDLPPVGWNDTEKRCEMRNIGLARLISEPYWRDPSHSVCRLTNFTHGENHVPGYFSRDAALNNETVKRANLEGFLEKNTKTYCRAFDKQLNDETGECENTWWEKALIYTILGEGIIRIVRNIVAGSSGCYDEAFRPTKDELGVNGNDDAVDLDPFLTYTLRQWRGDVNTSFQLPPPNVTLRDLGIDVRVTGNRLYWNNFEGIVSHLAFFRSVEMVSDGSVNNSSDTFASNDWRSKYANYNDKVSSSTGMWSELGQGDSSVRFKPTTATVISEAFANLFNAMSDSNGGGGGEFNTDDVNKLIEHINSTANENQLIEMLKEFGIQFSTDYARAKFTGALKSMLKKLLQYSVKSLGGKVAGALMRTGLRIGISQLMGKVLSQLTTRLLIAAGFASTGIGAVITVVEVLSMIVDIAITFGWDPGNYNVYTSSAAFRPLMDANFFALIRENAVDVTPDMIVTILLAATVDNADQEKKAADGKGTADARPTDETKNQPSFSDETSIDLRVSVQRWYNRNWSNCFERSADKLAVTESGEKLTTPRLALENDDTLWVQLNVFLYLGSLETNSYGQLVNLQDQTSEFDDATVADLVQEMDYRDLTTVSSKRSIDNRSYNKRVNKYQKLGAALIGVSTAFAIALSAVTLFERKSKSIIFSVLLMVLLVAGLLVVWVTCWMFNVFDAQFVDEATSLPATSGKDPDKPKLDVDLAKQISPETKRLQLTRIMRILMGNL